MPGHKRALSLAVLQTALRTASPQWPVPLLVLRLPDFERIAWRSGRREAQRLERATTRAFLAACARALRTGDLTGHDRGSDVFVITMSAPAREGTAPSAFDARSVLERVAAAVSVTSGLRIETGWTVLRRPESAQDLSEEIDRALERGARERERFEFFAAIGHELRTPLTSIRGYLETLIDGETDAATSARFLRTARREAMRMARLIDGMFEFSLLDLSAGALLGQSCAIEEQIGIALEVLRPLAQGRGIRISSELGGCRGAFAALEADACLQLLVNLVDNAIKYGDEGGRVAVSATCTRGEVAVRVDDDGPGIAEHERDSIFALRVRGARTASRPGTGIGLAIVKMIAERAGGAIRAAESPLGGARFEVTLPLRAEFEAPVA